MTQTVHLAVAQWEDLYEPLFDAEGVMEEIEFDQTAALHALREANRLWTQYDNDTVVNEIGYVNRMRYVATKYPYNPDVTIEVYDTYTFRLLDHPTGEVLGDTDDGCWYRNLSENECREIIVQELDVYEDFEIEWLYGNAPSSLQDVTVFNQEWLDEN